jgi:hypothetical protein
MTGIPKVLLGLALGLPMGAYAVGSIVSSAADDPTRRAPIILEDAPAPAQGTVPGATLRPSADPTPRGDDGDDNGDDGGGDRDDDEVRNRPEVVVPTFVDRDDDDDDRDDDRDDTDTDDGDGDDD